MIDNELSEGLNGLRAPEIRAMFKWLPDETVKATRKADLIAHLGQCLDNTTTLKTLVEALDPLQRLALAEAVHDDGSLDMRRFRARHGKEPAIVRASSSRRQSCEPGPLHLLMYRLDRQWRVPQRLRTRLKPLLEAPEPLQLVPVQRLPEQIKGERLQIHASETVALAELGIVLRLVHNGKLAVSAKTKKPSATALRTIGEQLVDGDMYPITPPKKYQQVIGPIRAFAWPLLLQAGKLAKLNGGKLALTRAGVRAMSAPAADVLRDLWKKWQKVTFFDEFRRVEAIKGQMSRGPGMTALVPRRQMISMALEECPVNGWIDIDEFGRFMQAEDFDFDITHDPWKLYIGERQYGSLGYEGFHEWHILQKRYLMAVLFEYAATLGMVDVAYLEPAMESATRKLWVTEHLTFLSRYDGLRYFRLTALGSWCLGLSAEYEPALPPDQAGLSLTLMPNLSIRTSNSQPDATSDLA